MAGGLGCSATACIERQLGDGKPSTRDDQDFPSLNMSSLAGVLMGSIERFLTTLRFINGKETLIYYLILLAVFSLIGWILGTVDITLKENGSHFLIKMGAATAIALFTSVAVSFYVFNAMQIIFFFEV